LEDMWDLASTRAISEDNRPVKQQTKTTIYNTCSQSNSSIGGDGVDVFSTLGLISIMLLYRTLKFTSFKS